MLKCQWIEKNALSFMKKKNYIKFEDIPVNEKNLVKSGKHYLKWLPLTHDTSTINIMHLFKEV